MRPYVLGTALLAAAAGPYVASNVGWNKPIPANLTAFVNQIEGLNAKVDSSGSSVNFGGSGATFGGSNSTLGGVNAPAGGNFQLPKIEGGGNKPYSFTAPEGTTGRFTPPALPESAATRSTHAGGPVGGPVNQGFAGNPPFSGRQGVPAQFVNGEKQNSGGNSSDNNTFGAITSNVSQSSSGSTNGIGSGGGNNSNSEPKKLGETDPIYTFHEVLRFDVTPSWVTSHWPRVTTMLAELELEGLRVPLVTGVKPDDIAGSLTYYFDKQHKLQRLTFQGFTGDERRLVQFVTQSYQLKKTPTLGAGLYMVQWNSQPRSVLRLTHMPVVRTTTPNQRLEVMLEINRPRNHYGLSPEFDALLKMDHENGRW